MKILQIGRKKLVAVLAVLTMLVMALTITLMASDTNKGLSIHGVTLNPMADGSVQLLFDIGVANEAYANNLTTMLEYNPEYMVLSNHLDNTPLTTEGMNADDSYFMPAADLYTINDEVANPYQVMVVGTSGSEAYSRVDTVTSTMQLTLKLQSITDLTSVGGDVVLSDRVKEINIGGIAGFVPIIDASDTRVSLGTMSFRVEPEYLPEIVEKFGEITNTQDPTIDGDFLLRIQESAVSYSKMWSFGVYELVEIWSYQGYESKEYSNVVPGDYTFFYDFDFEHQIVSVEPTAPNVILDAYQAYDLGTIDDIATILGKYSPMVTATYANGTKENFLMPWAMANSSEFTYDYGVFYYDDGAVGAPVSDYDPTGNEQSGTTPDYVALQYFYIPTQGENDTVSYELFPVPIAVTVAITPIEALGVAAKNTTKTYELTYDFTLLINEVIALGLPSSVRIVTDILPDGATLNLDIPGWKSTNEDSVWPTTPNLSTLYAENAVNGIPRWPIVSDWTGTNSINQDNHLGVYGFEMSETYGGAAKYAFSTSEVQAKYPWLTVSDNWDGDVTATRTIVESADFTDANDYEVIYVDTITDSNGNPRATLEVSNKTDSMAVTSEFIVWTPDGTVISSDWFVNAATNGEYSTSYYTQSSGDNFRVFNIHMNSGYTDLGYDYDSLLENLRRHINLGGWFYVSINEDVAAGRAWSDFIPVYVPPRDNQHVNSVEYHLVGINKDLIDYPTSTYVALPPGEYQPVDKNGALIYIDETGIETTDSETAGVENQLAVRDFGVVTTYDGITGAQPGLMTNFFVQQWDTVSLEAPTLATDAIQGTFPLDETTYQAFKTVINPDEHTALFSAEDPTTVPDVWDPEDPDAPVEKIILTSEYSKATYTGENVTLVTYDTVQEGYTMRQEVTLTITNVGDLDIYGLYIDLTTDDDGNGGHFTMLREPSSFLAVGQSTTFTMTYVYNLLANGEDFGEEDPYLDTIFILSSRQNDSTSNNYLLDFDATFEVSDESVYPVFVFYEPVSGDMGTAEVVKGVVEDAGLKMDVSSTTNTYVAGSTVYVGVNPLDEYTVKSISYTIGGYTEEYIPNSYVSGDGTLTAEVPEDWLVYTFPMPENYVEVVVVFEESLYSKLRMDDIDAFAVTASGSTDASDKLKPNELDPPEYLLYQKVFSDEDLLDAVEFEAASGGSRTQDEYLVQVGSAVNELYYSSYPQYLVVIPYDATYAQLEAILREVNTSVDGNYAINPNVSMELIGSEPTDTTTTYIYDVTEGSTNPPSTHISDPFQAPEMGESVYVRITISAEEDGITQYRYYYIEIHRSSSEIYAELNYGNSPYGLMMNDNQVPWDDDTTKESKLIALQAFIDNDYSFTGLGAYIPRVVTEYDATTGRSMTSFNYWTEAWAKSDSGYTLDTIYEPDSSAGVNNTSIYDVGDNHDLKETSLFIEINQEFYEPGVLEIRDNAGRSVDLDLIVRYVDIVLLDEEADTEIEKFSEPEVDDATRTKWRLQLGKANENEVASGWAQEAIRPVTDLTGTQFNVVNGRYVYLQELDIDDNPVYDGEGNPVYVQFEVGQIRPGIYDLIYSFTDFDQTTTVDSIIRPIVLLGPVGDINGDTERDSLDVQSIFGRVDNPLGYYVEEYAQANLFRFRQVDVNNDRNINNIDANELNTNRDKIVSYYLYTDFIPDNSVPEEGGTTEPGGNGGEETPEPETT